MPHIAASAARPLGLSAAARCHLGITIMIITSIQFTSISSIIAMTVTITVSIVSYIITTIIRCHLGLRSLELFV